MAIADILATAPMPEALQKDLALYAGCVAGAAQIDDLQSMLVEVGFTNIRVQPKEGSKALIQEWGAGRHLDDFIVSASIEAVKPSDSL